MSSCKSDLETSRAECELLSGRSERMEKEFEIEMEKMRDELKELRSSHEKELAQLLKRHEMEMSSLLKRREVEITTHDEEICKAREKYVKLQEKFELEMRTHNGEISKMSDTLEEMKRSFQTERKKLIETHNKEMFKVTEEHDELVVRLNKSFEVEKEELEEMCVMFERSVRELKFYRLLILSNTNARSQVRVEDEGNAILFGTENV